MLDFFAAAVELVLPILLLDFGFLSNLVDCALGWVGSDSTGWNMALAITYVFVFCFMVEYPGRILAGLFR